MACLLLPKQADAKRAPLVLELAGPAGRAVSEGRKRSRPRAGFAAALYRGPTDRPASYAASWKEAWVLPGARGDGGAAAARPAMLCMTRQLCITASSSESSASLPEGAEARRARCVGLRRGSPCAAAERCCGGCAVVSPAPRRSGLAA
jgi:hypothetical protein